MKGRCRNGLTYIADHNRGHRAVEILCREGLHLKVKFQDGTERWVNMTPLCRKHPTLRPLGIFEWNAAKHFKVTNDGGLSIANGTHVVSGPTLYHMGQTHRAALSLG